MNPLVPDLAIVPTTRECEKLISSRFRSLRRTEVVDKVGLGH